MKTFLLAAALAAGPTLAAAQASPACVAKPNQSSRRRMIEEADAWRSLELPPGDPEAATFGPRLDAIKARLQAAGDDDPGLPALRRDFHDWKVALLKVKYRNPSASGRLGRDFCAYVNTASREATAVADISRALSRQGQADRATLEMFRRFSSAASPFDGAALRGGAPEGPSAPEASSAADPYDPARYDKVRQILISEGASRRVVDAAIREALSQRKDPLLVLAVINAESGFNPRAHSSVGARGLMQIMPGTGRGLGVRDAGRLYDVETNLRAGVRYLGSLWDKFADFSMTSLQTVNPFSRHDVKEVVAAYNAGPGAVDKYGGVPPYRETQKYVRNVLSFYEKLKSYLAA